MGDVEDVIDRAPGSSDAQSAGVGGAEVGFNGAT